jgi:hypothetical protein
MKQFLLVIILLLVASLIAACGAGSAKSQVESAQAAEPASSQPDTIAGEALPPVPAEAQPQAAALAVFEPQSNSDQAVTVQVTPLNLPGGGETLDFEVAFNTHSVDLSFDPAAISVLRDDQGREYPAAGWEGSEAGGHHRSGVLKFAAPENTPAFVEVIIRDVAGVPERVFRWELNS